MIRPHAWLITAALGLTLPSTVPSTSWAQAPAEEASSTVGALAVEPSDAPVFQGESPARTTEALRFQARLLVDDARVAFPVPSDTRMSFGIHGSYQMRFRAMTDLPLERPIGAAPGFADTLGQNASLYHWMRLRSAFQYGRTFRVVGELDFPRGQIAGDTTLLVDAARDAQAELQAYEFHPRKLFLEYRSAIGLIRAGHQTSHWGMGVLANDGDHASLFGDNRRGAIVERLLFATRPLGEGTPLVLALAGDLVFEDARADLIDGDRALQAVAAVRWQQDAGEIGVYGVLRRQERAQDALDEFARFTEELTVGVIDVAGRFALPLPTAGAILHGAFEAVYVGGDTNMLRTVRQTAAGESETISNYGAAARLGVVRVAKAADGTRYGDIALTLAWGYASGDADPYDGVTKRFTFDQNHKVGLILFDHVLAHKTARAATIAQDPGLTGRGAPGLQFLPSEGAVFGASYLNPTVVVRPRHWLDLKAGILLAQTTADFVDPFHVGALGEVANYDGGAESGHNLGLEVDLGLEARHAVGAQMVLNFGVDGGVLFPGNALADAAGSVLQTQYLLNTKFGLNY